MKIWIRSQDKKILIKSNNIQVCNSDCKWLILTHGNIVATYSSKEKALKVLDMIQENIVRKEELKMLCQICDRSNFTVNLDGCVFEMPQDDEV